MMKNRSLILLTASLVILTAMGLGKRPQKASQTGGPQTIAEAAAGLPQSANRLGFDLFAQLTKRAPEENVFVSPYSIHTALCMAYSGARGQTAKAMARVMHLAIPARGVMEACLDLKSGLASADSLVRLEIANSLWSRRGLPLKAEFKSGVEKYFEGAARELDFRDPGALKSINGWVNEKTSGKIDRIIEQIPPDAALYLINAVYFKGNWQTRFDPRQTRDQDFALPGGQDKKMPFMCQDGEYQYLRGENFQAVRLPYGAGRFAMYLFLPDNRDGLGALIKQATQENWDIWLSGFKKNKGHVELPRFKAQYFRDLVPALDRLGMGPAFGSAADFSGMGPEGLTIDQVLHKAVVEVNEEGTVAAAVTSVGVRVTSVQPGPEPFRMVVDHPFLMAIAEQNTGSILFLGAIYQPE